MYFELRTGRMVWWPATVEELCFNSTDEDVIADAVIVYHAAFEYVAESASVQFLKDRTVRSKVISYVDASWLLSGDRPPVRGKTGHGNVMTPERVTRTRGPHSAAKVSTEDIRRLDRLNQDEDSDSDLSDDEGLAGSSPSLKRRKTTTGSANSVWRAADAPGLQDMHERIVRLEAINDTNRMCDHREIIESRVRAMRVIMMDELLRNASSLPRPRVSHNNESYMHVLSTGCVEHDFHIDYNLFQYLLRDIEKNMRPYGSVLYTPNAEEMMGRTARANRHVIFRTAKSFFSWLGITEDMNRKAVLIEERDQLASGGTQALRVMGSLRRNDEQDMASIQILVGRSASQVATGRSEEDDPAVRAMEEHPTCGDGDIPCLAYANAKWDDESNDFEEKLSECMGHTGPLSEDHIQSCFSISWKAKKPLARGKYKLTPNLSEGVQLGTLTVRYPYVLLRGRLPCDQARVLLHDMNLADVL